MSTILVDCIRNGNLNKDPKRDYYFIVLNKDQPTDVIINSLT